MAKWSRLGSLDTGRIVRRILLASESPRRRVLLESAGYEIDVEPQHIDESLKGGPISAAVESLALEKLKSAGHRSIAVVAADTVVVFNEQPLGKPANESEAVRMLQLLEGKQHQVITGVGVSAGGRFDLFSVTTDVWFRPLSLEEINRYVSLGESLDKAGGYGIQSAGASLVERVRGSYTNIVGLPLRETIEALEALI